MGTQQVNIDCLWSLLADAEQCITMYHTITVCHATFSNCHHVRCAVEAAHLSASHPTSWWGCPLPPYSTFVQTQVCQASNDGETSNTSQVESHNPHHQRGGLLGCCQVLKQHFCRLLLHV